MFNIQIQIQTPKNMKIHMVSLLIYRHLYKGMKNNRVPFRELELRHHALGTPCA